MRLLFSIFFFFIAKLSWTQNRFISYSTIDWQVQSIDAPAPDSLAKKLIFAYKTDLEKVRAIFSWMVKNIAYNTDIYNVSWKGSASKYTIEPIDTISVWKSANEMTAQKVLRRRVAICDGYAKLFKTLCDYAGICSEIITGYAKCRLERNEKFRTNHSWNAVMIDSSWYLLDVTWASGYINYSNEFVQHTDEFYFLTPPRQFILDHYPDDLRWTLLENPPVLREFQFSPYKCKSFVKYSIQVHQPSKGIVEAAVGDTVKIELLVRAAAKDKNISADPFFDSSLLIQSPASTFLEPLFEGNKVVYTYVVTSNAIQWLHLLYNDDIVLRYRLNVRNDKLPVE